MATELCDIARSAKGKTVAATQALFSYVGQVLAKRKEKRGIYRCWILTVSGRNYAHVKNKLMKDIDINKSALKRGCGAKFIGIADGTNSLSAYIKMHACLDRSGFKKQINLNSLNDVNFKTVPFDEFDDIMNWACICSKVNIVSCNSFLRRGFLSGIPDSNTWVGTPIGPVAMAEVVVIEELEKLHITP